jgi:hypothetical protein
MEESYECYWDVHPESDIRVCTNGEVEGTIVKYKNKYVVRKKKGNKRYEVGRLILETFANEEEAGNYKGRGTVVWKDKNKRNNHILNLKWKDGGDGWGEKSYNAMQDVIVQSIIAIPGLEDMAERMRKHLEKQRNTPVKFDKEEILKKLTGGC